MPSNAITDCGMFFCQTKERVMRVLLVFLATFIAGCVTPHSSYRGNVLALDERGDVRNLSTGQSCRSEICSNQQIERLIKDEEKDKDKPLLIFIHGGLNTDAAAFERADKYVPEMTAAGFHPIFINWKSGFITSYGEHLFHDRQGDYWTFWGYMSSPFILAQDIGRGVFQAPMVWWYQTNSYFKSISFGEYPGERNAFLVNKMLLDKSHPLEFKDVPQAITTIADRRSGWEKFGDGTLGLGKLLLGLTTAPIFDSLGTGSWDAMKRRIDVSLAKEKATGANRHLSLDQYNEVRKGGVTRLFEEIKRTPNRKIILVGHSMGTIMASDILRRWPELKYQRIIFMAAACTIEDFQTAVAPQLKKEMDAPEFYNYMLHPIAENQEAHIFGLGGTGTLLNQIDNIYENARSGNKRTLGKWANVMNHIDLFNVPGKEKITLRTMPYDSDYPTRHGDFDDAIYNNVRSKRFWDTDFGVVKR
jgi:hypothetical protein